MNFDIDDHIYNLYILVNAPHFHKLTKMEIASINAGISALKTIQDGNYKLETNNINIDVKHAPDITKEEVIATLIALANIIEKGEI